MQILTSNLSNNYIEEFNCFVLDYPEGNFFQSIFAYKLFSKLKNYKPILLIAVEEGKILGSLLAALIYSGKGIKNISLKDALFWGDQ